MEMLSRDELTYVAGGDDQDGIDPPNPTVQLTLSQVSAAYTAGNNAFTGSYNWNNGNSSAGMSHTQGNVTYGIKITAGSSGGGSNSGGGSGVDYGIQSIHATLVVNL